MKKLIQIAFISLGLIMPAYAKEGTKLSFLALTHHPDYSDAEWLHPMLVFEFDEKWVVGGFKNSARDISFYAARRFQWSRPYIEIGLATGYDDDHPVRSIRYGLKITENIDLMIGPEFKNNDNFDIKDPVGVIGTVFKVSL